MIDLFMIILLWLALTINTIMNRFYVPYVVGRCVAKNVHEENHMQIWSVIYLGIMVMLTFSLMVSANDDDDNENDDDKDDHDFSSSAKLVGEWMPTNLTSAENLSLPTLASLLSGEDDHDHSDYTNDDANVDVDDAF